MNGAMNFIGNQIYTYVARKMVQVEKPSPRRGLSSLKGKCAGKDLLIRPSVCTIDMTLALGPKLSLKSLDH